MSNVKTRIMYIQQGWGGSDALSRVGRVTFSRTGSTLYYRGRCFFSLKGGGYKTSHFDEETREGYWISGPRKDGQDTLYPGLVEIDEDVREEYWTAVRGRPQDVAKTRFRSLGRHAKHATR